MQLYVSLICSITSIDLEFKMNETEHMLALLPIRPYSTPGSGWFKVPAPNAYVCLGGEYIEIYPLEGGALYCDTLAGTEPPVQGDIAPFCD